MNKTIISFIAACILPMFSYADIHSLIGFTYKVDDFFKYEQSPFILACQEKKDLLVGRPETGLFIRNVPEHDANRKSSRIFLDSVATQALYKVFKTESQVNNLEVCLDNATDANCDLITRWIRLDLPEYVRRARYHLSLSQTQYQFKTILKSTSYEVNTDLESPGTYKLVEWQPLTIQEKERAEATIKEYISELTESANSDSSLTTSHPSNQESVKRKFIEHSFLVIRLRHFSEYRKMLSELPLMHYLSESNISEQGLRTALKKLKADLEKEKRYLMGLKEQLKLSSLPSSVLSLMKYSQIVEESLLKNNSYCAIASSLEFTLQNRQLGNSLAIMLPIMVASSVAAPIVLAVGGTAVAATTAAYGAAAIGTGIGVGISYYDVLDARNLVVGHIYRNDSGLAQQNLDQSQRALVYSVVFIPAGFGLSGQIGKTAMTLKSSAVSTGLRVFKSWNK